MHQMGAPGHEAKAGNGPTRQQPGVPKATPEEAKPGAPILNKLMQQLQVPPRQKAEVEAGSSSQQDPFKPLPPSYFQQQQQQQQEETSRASGKEEVLARLDALMRAHSASKPSATSGPAPPRLVEAHK